MILQTDVQGQTEKFLGLNPYFPFARNVQFLWDGRHHRNAAYNKAALTRSENGISIKRASRGNGRFRMGLTGSGAGSGKYTGTIAADATAVTWVVMAANMVTFNGRPASTFNGSGGHDIFCNAGVACFQEIFGGGANGQYTVSGLWTGARPECAAYANACVSGGGPTAIFVDGVSRSWTVASAQSGTRTAGGTNVAVAGRPDVTTRQFGGDVLFVALLNIVVPNPWLKLLSQNPDVMLAPQERRSWQTDLTAPGGITVPVAYRQRQMQGMAA